MDVPPLAISPSSSSSDSELVRMCFFSFRVICPEKFSAQFGTDLGSDILFCNKLRTEQELKPLYWERMTLLVGLRPGLSYYADNKEVEEDNTDVDC